MKGSQRIVITVDGLAASGKTSLSRLLAQRLGYCHFSSGLLYRGLGILAQEQGVSIQDSKALVCLLEKHRIEILADAGQKSVLYLDGVIQPEEKVQAPAVSEAASVVSAFGEVRKALIPAQREAFPGSNIVAEGRDMGTVIFPDAPLKFFVEVGVETRVQRRLAQLAASGKSGTLSAEDIRREIHDRDKRDTEREHAPARAADDAVIIDNSQASIEEVLDRMESEIRKKTAQAVL